MTCSVCLFGLIAIPASAEPEALAGEAAGSVTGSARTACSQEVAARVQRHYDSVKDFSADFEQTTRSVLFGAAGVAAGEASRGQVVFSKPGKMRWTYTHPEESLVVSDGKTLWLYSASLKEAQRLTMTDGYLTGAALSFLLGDGKLLETFRVTAVDCEAGRLVQLELLPRQAASYERLGLEVVQSTGEVVATSVLDVFGNETTIAFEHVQRNQDPPPTLFEFEPGPEVRVIEIEGS
jgi:outer membrane lipoprotein carrier protein